MDGRRPPHAAGLDTPPGYVTLTLDGAIWMVLSECVASLPSSGAGRLLEEATGPGVAPGSGRAGVVPLRIGRFEAVGKQTRHGGAARWLGGLFLGRRRAVGPLLAALRLRASGVPTPRVLAAAWRRVLGPIHAHALVTETIPGGINLQAALAGGISGANRRAALAAAGSSVRTMHEAGFLHADLNLANLVLEPRTDGPRAYVVDLDRGRFVSRVSPQQRRASLARLHRSWEKWRPGGNPPVLRDGVAFLRGYCFGDPSAIRGLLADVATASRSLALHRAIWHLTGKPGGRTSSGAQE